MNIFKEARLNYRNGKGYRARRAKTIWKNKKCKWNWVSIEYGIRWSNHLQIFPVWNMSCNTKRALMFGFMKLYFQVNYNRKKGFDQSQKIYFFHDRLLKTYQLFL